MYPKAPSPRRKPSRCGFESSSDRLLRKPTVGTVCCWARATAGHTMPPPTSPRNSRRLMPCLRLCAPIHRLADIAVCVRTTSACRRDRTNSIGAGEGKRTLVCSLGSSTLSAGQECERRTDRSYCARVFWTVAVISSSQSISLALLPRCSIKCCTRQQPARLQIGAVNVQHVELVDQISKDDRAVAGHGL